MTAAVPDIREQMARALAEHPWHEPSFPGDTVASHVNHQYYYRCAVCQGDTEAMAVALLLVVTAHVAAERERAVAEVVEPIRALHTPEHRRWRGGKGIMTSGLDENGRGRCSQNDAAWPCPTIAALPVQPADHSCQNCYGDGLLSDGLCEQCRDQAQETDR